MEIQFNIKRPSQLLNMGLEPNVAITLKEDFDDLMAQSVNKNSDLSTIKNQGNASFKFTGVSDEEASIDKRLNFLNSPIVQVTKFPVFIFAKKGFELTQVLSGLPFRENYEEKTDFTAIRKWSEWHTENNTSIIQENENYVLIRTEVLSIPLTDTELVILNAARQPSSTEPIDLTTSQFQLWGMQEYKALKSVYFPVLEDSL